MVCVFTINVFNRKKKFTKCEGRSIKDFNFFMCVYIQLKIQQSVYKLKRWQFNTQNIFNQIWL